jgi:hypothetical protein
MYRADRKEGDRTLGKAAGQRWMGCVMKLSSRQHTYTTYQRVIPSILYATVAQCNRGGVSVQVVGIQNCPDQVLLHSLDGN